MKTFTKFLTMLAVAALFATGCVNEEPPYKEDPNPEPAGTTGYLSIGNLSMTVVYDETEIRPDDTSDETQAARTASGTRATAPDVDSFIVEILDADNAQVLEMTYAQLKEQLKTPMELKVGAYRMEVRSEDTMPGVDWEHPVYGATSDFTITKAQTTSPEEVVCTLQNIKVSVEYSSELADMLADTSKATVSLGDTSLAFPKTETRAAYFKPQALENTLDFVFDGTFADTDVPAKFSKQITGVKAGQWRKVSVVIGYADKGNILFSVKVDNSILQDNKFVVDGTENLGEELLEDPNAPALTWPGHDMTQPFTLTDAMFDAEGNCIEPFAFDLSSPNGIESLQVTVGSTNSQFLASMAAIQLPETFDLCALDASSAAGIILKGFGYPVGSELKGQTAKSFNIAGQIRALYEFDGTHTFAFTMTDAKGVSSEAVLTLAVDKSSGQTGPRITWRGYDIDQQYEVQKDMVIDIAEIQKYVSGEKKYRILAFSELTRFTVSVGDKSYDALNGTTEGISLEPVDKYNVRLTLSDAFFASCQAGDQKVTLRIEDANGGSSEVATTYRLEGLVPVTADDYDLWANTVTLRVVSFTPGTTVQFGLRSSGGEWQPMAGTSQGDDFITATYAPQWVPQTVKEQTVYTQAAGTGIIATHSYDFRAIINGTETTGTFTAGEVQPIPNGDMSGWSMTGGFAFPNAAGESFWSSGNNTMTKTLCTSTDVKFGKSAPAAKLTSTNMLVLAAGNLFTGEFAYKSFTGTVQFGQTYAFTARPSAMKVKYHAHVGTVDKVRTSGDICPYIKKGDPDMARIFVAIVDWNAPHEVVSGMTTTKGAWDPEKGIDNVSEGKILGYGSLWITQSTDGEDMQDAELDIVWYDHETRPAEGKYSLVISCACNAYGDYFTGCSKNVMYVDDFEWVY